MVRHKIKIFTQHQKKKTLYEISCIKNLITVRKRIIEKEERMQLNLCLKMEYS